MKEVEGLSLEEIQAFLEASEPVQFEAKDRASLYEWVTRTLREQRYDRFPEAGKAIGGTRNTVLAAP